MLPGVENQKAAHKRKRQVSENLGLDGKPLYQLKITLKGPNPEHKSMKEWLGYDLDAARFDVEIANGVLNRLKA